VLLICRDVVLGLGPWLSLVVLKDKTGVLGPGLGLESLVLGPCLEIHVLKQVTHCSVWFSKNQWQLHAAFPVSQG